VLVGVVAVVLFLVVAGAVPTWAITVTAVTATALIAVIVVLGRVPRTPSLQGGEPSQAVRV
jgi:hypothetical protein